MTNEIKQFAPVVIPTLCRHEHLKRLLESLERCKYADQTEVYLGVDYPAKESHRPGYEKIIEYLHSRQFNFKKFHIIYRERNYGMEKDGNYTNLLKLVSERHTRFISSEDDNEFSPNFLEYINLNLEKYEDDPSVTYICGYLNKDISLNTNFTQFRSHGFSAWGCGSWFKKANIFRTDGMAKKILSKMNLEGYAQGNERKAHFLSLVYMSKGGPYLGDVVISSYQSVYNTYSIFPTLSLVRNYGWDGSGTHGGIVPGYSTQPIDDKDSFEIVMAPDDVSKQIEQDEFDQRKNSGRFIDKLLINICFYLYRYTKIFINPLKVRRFIKKIILFNQK